MRDSTLAKADLRHQSLVDHRQAMATRLFFLALAFAASTAAHLTDRRQGARRDLVAAKKLEPKPPAFLKGAYSAAGLATVGAWSTVVWTTIRSNQPQGAMMPSVQHGIFARSSVLSAVPLIASCYATLVSASGDSGYAVGTAG